MRVFVCVSLQNISLAAEGCLPVINCGFESAVRHSTELTALMNCSHWLFPKVEFLRDDPRDHRKHTCIYSPPEDPLQPPMTPYREHLSPFHATCCDLECLKEQGHDLQPCPAAAFRACASVCTHVPQTTAALPRSWIENLERFHLWHCPFPCKNPFSICETLMI